MALARIKEYLDQRDVRYEMIPHGVAFTAQETAEKAHVSGYAIAKTVVVKLDGRLAMAVVRAPQLVDFDLLQRASGADVVDLATESEFARVFPNCEIGAMPPFGNLFEMEVYVCESLSGDREVAFNACSHTELMRMSFAEFVRVVQPKIVPLGRWMRAGQKKSMPVDPSRS